MKGTSIFKQRSENVHCWCRICWWRGYFMFMWAEMEGKTLEELRLMCEYRHSTIHKCPKADVRLK